MIRLNRVQKLTKMKKILTFLILALLFSCEKDNETPEAEPEIFITIATNVFELSYADRHYFITDLDGQLLVYKKLEMQETNILYAENFEIPDKFNVHRLYVSKEYDVHYLESFLNTSQTSYTHYSACESPLQSMGNCTVNIVGPTYTSYLISYPAGGNGGYSPNQSHALNRTCETYLYDGHNFLYALLHRDQQYYYQYFFDLEPNEIYNFELDPNTMNTDYNIQIVDAPEGTLFLNGHIKSVILGGPCYYSRCSVYEEISTDSTQMSIFITPCGLEKYYQSNIYLQVDENRDYRFSKHGDIPEYIPLLDFDFTNYNLDVDNISLTTSGSYDIINGNYRNETNAKNWDFYTDIAENIKFPEIPEEITNQHPTITNDAFFGTSNVAGTISLIEYTEIDNYPEFMSDFEQYKRLGENAASQTLTVRNY